jgi:hypothetical protein
MRISCNPATAILLAFICLAPEAIAQANLDRRTSIDVDSATPRDVYGSLAKTLGCDLAMAPEIKQPITLRITNVTVRTALNAISESIGCQWSLKGNLLQVDLGKGSSGGVVGGVPGGVSGGVVGGVPGGVVGGVDFRQRLERKTPPNFRFENVALGDVMKALGKIAELETRLESPMTDRHVTIDLSERTILAAFKSIQQEVGLDQSVVFAASLPGTNKKIMFKMGPQKKP